jgi:hypothetical protein
MIIGADGSSGGRKCGERWRKTGACEARSARNVEDTPPRAPPRTLRYRTTDTVTCTSLGLTKGLDEIE